jgi:hypothetical protein
MGMDVMNLRKSWRSRRFPNLSHQKTGLDATGSKKSRVQPQEARRRIGKSDGIAISSEVGPPHAPK